MADRLILYKKTPKKIIKMWEKKTGLKWNEFRWKAMLDILIHTKSGRKYFAQIFDLYAEISLAERRKKYER